MKKFRDVVGVLLMALGVGGGFSGIRGASGLGQNCFCNVFLAFDDHCLLRCTTASARALVRNLARKRPENTNLSHQ